jgi:hypothetical protein
MLSAWAAAAIAAAEGADPIPEDEAARQAYWEGRWREVCSYDCGARYGGGCLQVAKATNFTEPGQCSQKEELLAAKAPVTWTQPQTEAVQALTVRRNSILDFAKKYDVDPRAIAAASLAENSMNHTEKAGAMKDMLQALSINGKVFGVRAISFGYGQIYQASAARADAYMAGIEHRQPRSEDEITRMIVDPIGSLELTAMMERMSEDVYRDACQLDVRGQYTILVTLYNISPYTDDKATNNHGTQPRCKTGINAGHPPKVNYFGFFAERWQNVIENIVGYQPPQIAGAPQEKSAGSLVSKKDLDLMNAYPDCYGTKQIKPAGTLHSGIALEKIDTAKACDLTSWSLVSTQDGSRGWIKTADFQAEVKPGIPKKTCSPAPKADCEKKVTSALNKSSRTPKASDDGLLVKMYSKKVCGNGAGQADTIADDPFLPKKCVDFVQNLPKSADYLSDFSSYVRNPQAALTDAKKAKISADLSKLCGQTDNAHVNGDCAHCREENAAAEIPPKVPVIDQAKKAAEKLLDPDTLLAQKLADLFPIPDIADDRQCDYDRPDTIGFLMELAQDKCVKSVTVSDMWLFETLNSKNVPVLYQNFRDPNQMLIRPASDYDCKVNK